MSDLKLAFTIEAIDAVTAPIRRMTSAIAGPAQRLKQAFGQGRETLERFGKSYEGIAALVGGGFEIRDIIADDDYFNRLRVQYGLTREAADHLQESIHLAAAANFAAVSDVQAAAETYRQLGGGIETFAEQAGIAAKVVALLGGQGSVVGEAMAGLQRSFGIEGPKAMSEALATLYEQTKRAPGGLAAAADGLNRLAELYASTGHTGLSAARDIGAVYGTIVKGTGNARAARSALEQLLLLVQPTAVSEQLKLEGLGIKVFNKPGDVNSGVRALPDIIRSIGDVLRTPAGALVGGTLSPELIKGLSTMVKEVGQSGRSTTLESLLGIKGDPRQIDRDVAEIGTSLTSSLTQIRDELLKFGDDNLTGPIRFVAQHLRDMGGAAIWAINILAGLAIFGLAAGWITQAVAALRLFAIIGTLTTMVGNFLTALRAGYGVVAAFNLVLSANPIGVVVLAIAALVAAAFLIFRYWGPIKEFFVGLWGGIKATFGDAVAFVRAHAAQFLTALGPIGAIVAVIIDHWSEVTGFFAGLWDDITTDFKSFESFVTGFVDRVAAVMAALPEALGEAWDGVKGYFAGLWDNITADFKGFESFVTGFVVRVAAAIDALPEALGEAWDGVKAFFTEALNWLDKNFVAPFRNLIGSVEDAIPAFLKRRLGIPSQTAPAASTGDAARAPAFAGAAGAGAAGQSRVGGNITVRFENAPPGLRPAGVRSDNPAVPLDLSMGYAMVAP